MDDHANATQAVLDILLDGKWHFTTEFQGGSTGSSGRRRLRDIKNLGYTYDAVPASTVFPEMKGSREYVYRITSVPQSTVQPSPPSPTSSAPLVGNVPPMPSWIQPEEFFHTHLHSIFSLRDGMITVAGLVDHAREQKQRAVAITDHGLLGSAYELYMRATKAGLVPLIGLEVYTSPYREVLLSERERLSTVFKNDKDLRERVRRLLSKSYHLLVLSYNPQGYKTLLKIHNEAQTNGFYRSARTTNERILEANEGLVVSTACFAGEIPQHLWRGNWREARYLVHRFKEAFGDRFFIELMLIDWDRQVQLNRRLIKLARETNTPMIFSCDAHYLRQEDSELHEILLNIDSIRDGKSREELAEEENLWEFSAKDLFVKTTEDIWKSFCLRHRNDVFTEDVLREGFENIARIGRMAEPLHLEHTPRLPSPEGAWEELNRRCESGLDKRVENGMIPRERVPDYRARLAFELDVIRQIQSVEYILLFSDVSRYCDENEIPRGPGRGSVGGSLVAWLVDITQVDPIRHGLLFERFLDLERLPRMKLDL